MYSPTRDQARLSFIDAWRKHQTHSVLTPMEGIITRILLLHPEYHALLDNSEEALAREWTPESGATNPFLHLSLHLAIEEQLSIGQPAGLRAAFDALCAKLGDRHAALHGVLECLAETLWQAQSAGTPMDGEAYVACVRRRR